MFKNAFSGTGPYFSDGQAKSLVLIHNINERCAPTTTVNRKSNFRLQPECRSGLHLLTGVIFFFLMWYFSVDILI